jgi:hypothetical protein
MKFNVTAFGLIDAEVEASCGFIHVEESDKGSSIDSLVSEFFQNHPLSCGVSVTFMKKVEGK